MKKKAGLLAASAFVSWWGGAEPAAAQQTSGTISVEMKIDGATEPPPGPAMAAFIVAIGDVLTGRGFTVLEGQGHAALVAEVTLSRAEVGTGTAKVATARSVVAPGDSPTQVGVGVSVPLPTAKSRLVPLQRTQMVLRIHKREDDATLWQGTAITVRAGGTNKGADGVVASDLTAALLRIYPAEPEGVIGVP